MWWAITHLDERLLLAKQRHQVARRRPLPLQRLVDARRQRRQLQAELGDAGSMSRLRCVGASRRRGGGGSGANRGRGVQAIAGAGRRCGEAAREILPADAGRAQEQERRHIEDGEDPAAPGEGGQAPSRQWDRGAGGTDPPL